METFVLRQRPLMRSCSVGDTTTQPATRQSLTQSADQCKERKKISRQRRITVGEPGASSFRTAALTVPDNSFAFCAFSFLAASFIPQSMDQNGNVSEKVLSSINVRPFVKTRDCSNNPGVAHQNLKSTFQEFYYDECKIKSFLKNCSNN